jgi:hypothetical protein
MAVRRVTVALVVILPELFDRSFDDVAGRRFGKAEQVLRPL